MTTPPVPPVPPVLVNPPVTFQPYYLRDTQNWAVEQEHLRHNEALYYVGEMAMFVLLWHLFDFQAGLVLRCARCYGQAGAVADVYGQPTINKCPECFGTTFEGGYRAKIIRPAIFADTDETEQVDRRGITHPDDVDVETTSDFRIRNGDYVFRADGSRWYLRAPQRTTLRTGFAYPSQQSEGIGYSSARAQVEDPSAVSYLIPPDGPTLRSILTTPSRVPQDYRAYEIIRSPLIPPGGLS